MILARSSKIFRAGLLASAAGLCLSLAAGAAQAATAEGSDPTISRPDRTDVVRESQGGTATASFDPVLESQGGSSTTDFAPLLEAQDLVRTPSPVDVVRVPEIVIANPNTPTTARDPNNITGVGQMVTDLGGGFVGLCTASLINPRTVVFAAHCINDEPATAYGVNHSGQALGFSFSNYTIPGIQAWFSSGFHTNVNNAFYNSNWTTYNLGSIEPNAAGFLYSDVAVAALDTPAEDIPTWAMLFSALPVPDSIGAAGTGYHVTIEGYGNNGTGTSGSNGGIDWRRRIAENIVGGLASLDQFENWLFGGAASDNPQNLYWIDFDDPRRGTAATPSIYDFNAWRDNAVADGKEGITAAGDSGGPLILDQAYATQLIIGVLSGGYTRFFTGQPANGYGTASFYQPLYLYWDWIAANNPYHYVSAVAGNGNWTDPNHWVTTLDPNYYVLDSNGNLINGVPTSLGEGKTGNSGTFGQACFQGAIAGGTSECLDMATGDDVFDPVHPIGTDGSSDTGLSNGGATKVAIGSLLDDDYGTASVDGAELTDETISKVAAEPEAQSSDSGGSQSALALPAATLDNGLPGATNFVPNNGEGNAFNKPRFFDVNLSATGTTTLSSNVTVDRFRITGAGAGLDITSAGTLKSLMDITQLTGTVQVNGNLVTNGDYFLMSGGLNGTGTVWAPYLTNVAGTIAPGTAGTVGTLNIKGNLVLSSGSTLLIDLGATSSDKIQVQANGTSTGAASLGGAVVFSWTNALRAGQQFTFLTTTGGYSGTFAAPVPFSAILTPKLKYSTSAVQVQVQAGNYRDLVTSGTVAYQVAQILDQNRGMQSNYDALYGPLDLQSASTIRSTLDSFAPTTETMIQALGAVGVNNMGNLIGNRLDSLEPGSLGGTLATYGSPLQVASLDMNRSMGGISGMGFGGPVMANDTAPSMVQEGALPDTMSAFVAGGYLNGDSAHMPGAIGSGRDDFDGWFAAGGIETTVGDNGVFGAAFGYTRLDGTGSLAGQTAKANLYQGAIYAKVETANGFAVDAQMQAGIFNVETNRAINLLGTPYSLTSTDNALAYLGEVGVGKDFDAGMVTVTPRLAGRIASVGFTPTVETGGPMAYQYDRHRVDSIEARAGLTIAGNGEKVRPWINGTYVHDFSDPETYVGTNLAGGIYGFAAMPVAGHDQDYAEISGGLTVKTGKVDVSISAESTIGRDDLTAQSYRGSLTLHF